MSTKTNFKRVALVAVASLGLGVITSIAPASATDAVAGDLVLTSSAAGVANAGLCTTLDATTAALARTIAVGGSQQFTHATSDAGRAVISGNASWAAGATAGTIQLCSAVEGNFGGAAPYQKEIINFTISNPTLNASEVYGQEALIELVYTKAVIVARQQTGTSTYVDYTYSDYWRVISSSVLPLTVDNT